MPLSASTKAPASSVHSLDTGFLWTYAVNPTAEAPCPVVNTTRGPVFSTYLRNCDFAVPGSPQSKTLISPLTLCLPPERKVHNYFRNIYRLSPSSVQQILLRIYAKNIQNYLDSLVPHQTLQVLCLSWYLHGRIWKGLYWRKSAKKKKRYYCNSPLYLMDT